MFVKKTNAARLLDKNHINYEIAEYPVDENDLSAVTVALKLGQNIEQVFKTLVLRGNTNGILIAIVPGNAEINLKKAAKISGNKSIEMVHVKELPGLTGYIRGACSPLAMKKNYPTFIHTTCQNFECIFVSAGKRGMQLKIHPNDLITITGAVVCELIGD